MKLIRNPEHKGILGLILIILLICALMAVGSGKLETWFGISLFSGPRILNKIAYVSDNSGVRDIYVMNTDGSDSKPLTTGANVTSAPFISPTGSRVVFVGKYRDGYQVFMVRGGGGNPNMLTTATGPKQHPAFSPNGKKLSFISSGTVYYTDINGESMVRVLPTEEDTHMAMMDRNSLPAYYTYAWGKDSERIAGVTRDSNDNDMLVYLRKTSGKSQKIPLSPDERVRINDISWAVDEPVLALSVEIGKKSMLVVFDSKTGQLRPLVAVKEQKINEVSFSPDASTIAAVLSTKAKSAASGIVLVNTSTGQGKLIAAGDFDSISYSPDGGKLLAVKVSDDGDQNIVTIDTANGEIKQLTSDGHSFDPVWSPVSAND